MARGFSMASIAGSRAVSRPIGNSSWIARPAFIPQARVGPSAYMGPRVSQNNPVLVRSFQNFNNMANDRAFTRGFHHPNAGGYSDAYGHMRSMVNQGIATNMVRKSSNQQPQERQVITITRPSTQRVQGPTAMGGKMINNAWSAQQNSAGLGRNRGYSNGMSKFAINNSYSANAGLNRMR